MNHRMVRGMRMAGCAALLVLLSVCGYAGAKAPQLRTVSIPVVMRSVSQSEWAAASSAQTKEDLLAVREASLAQLQEVIDHPQAAEETVRSALAEKARIASNAEREAALCALLAQMGFGDVSAVIGEASVSVIAPWQAAENERSRMQMIDAAASQTGFSAECVKIIPAKNE